MRSPAVAFLLLTGLAVVALTFAGAGLANHRAERKALTSQGQKLAKAILVRRADLAGSGWTSSPPEEQNDHEERCPGLWDPDLSDLTVVGDAQSLDFQSQAAVVGSGSTIYKTAGQARTAWRRVLVPSYLQCATTKIAAALRVGGANIVSARRLKPPELGTEAAAYRMVVRARSVGVLVYADVIAIRRARAAVAITVAGIAKPFPARTLARAVDRRMIAAGF